VASATDLHVVLRLRRVDVYLHSPISLHGVDKENFTVRSLYENVRHVVGRTESC